MGSFLSSFAAGGSSAEAGEYASSESSGVVAYHSANRWQLHLNSLKDSNQLMVVDFAASWCGPCKMMEPVVSGMASKLSDVGFAKIDVDELPEVAKEFKVEAMPTFVLLKRGKEVDRIVGARKDELEIKIHKHKS